MFDASSLSLSTDDQFVIRLANAVFFFYFQIFILMPPHLSHITTTYFLTLEQLLNELLLVQYNSLNDNENMI